MTYAVGDKFRVTRTFQNFRVGEIVNLHQLISNHGDGHNPQWFIKDSGERDLLNVGPKLPEVEPIENSQKQPTMRGGEKEMQKFKVGDKVKNHGGKEGILVCWNGSDGIIGEPTMAIYPDCEFCGTSKHKHGYYAKLSLGMTLISSANKPMANTLTKAQEAHLDEDSKALVKVGILGSNLSINSSTKAIEMLVELNYKALAEAAREQLAAEAKEAKGEIGEDEE